MSEEKKSTAILSPNFRASFPHLFKAKAFKDREPMFSVQMLIPKTDLEGIKRVKQACALAAKMKWGDTLPEGMRSPIKDGDKSKYANQKGMWVVEAKSKQKPGVVNQAKEEIIDPNEVYPGVWMRATIAPFAYDNTGNKGVSIGLRNVQKVKDDARFDNRTDPQDDFDFIEGFDGEKASLAPAKTDDLAEMF